MNNLHEAIRAVYPDAKIAINGFSIDEIVAVDQVTGEPFEFDNDLVLAKSQELYNQYQQQNLRRERDRRLAETDWVITMHKEKGTNIPAAWKTYRQALRDLPANTEDPANPVWPTKPE